jgi:hypothetical protein
MVPDDPWFMFMLSIIFSMVCAVFYAWGRRRDMRKIHVLLNRLLNDLTSASVSHPLQCQQERAPEPDPLASVPKEKLALLISKGFVGKDGKASKEQLETLKMLGLLEVEKKKEPSPAAPESNPESKSTEAEKHDGESLVEGVRSALKKATERQ